MSKKKATIVKKLSRIRRADPQLERELSKYELPLPSREYVLQLLEEHGVPLEFARICAALDVQPHELEAFRRRLDAMARAGQLLQNRAGAWLLPGKAALIRGRIEGHADGYGFLIPDDRNDYPADLFLSPREMAELMHGDRAMARVIGVDRRGRPEGKIVEILERSSAPVVGRLLSEHGVWFVAAENRRITHDILLSPEAADKALPPRRVGQVVVLDIVQPPSRYGQPIGRIKEVLGNYADPGMEIEIALRKHQLPFEFSADVAAEAKKLPAKVRKLDCKGRVDLTALPLVTIDGETARDFDDAVYCERLPGSGKSTGLYRLVVAIADVSHYVQPGSALDMEAVLRGNSVYFPRRVIPMLPEELSNGLCSLNPEVERLSLVCDMTITSSGRTQSYRFYPAVIRSHARLTYTQVAAAVFDGDELARQELSGLLPHLENLVTLYRLLAKARSKRGAIDFETIETRMLFDDNGKIERIVADERNEAHRLIEECMLAANVCAANFLRKHKHPGLYRVHEGPTADRLQRLREFLLPFGLQLGGGDNPQASDYGALLKQLAGRADRDLFQTVMLRSLRQAQYTPDNLGHFGLAYEAYAHYTSPIRRYPDLLLHRAIKAILNKQRYQPQVAPGESAETVWEALGQQCSLTERRADEATRDVVNWLKCYYMQDRIGEAYDGRIVAVVSFGIFVVLDEVYVEGLVHVSELGQDYFHFDETAHTMIGERSGKRFRLSDRVRVQVMRADLNSTRIDFRLLESSADKPGQKAGRKSGTQKDARGVEAPAASQPGAGLAGGKARKAGGKGGGKITPMPMPKQVVPVAHIQASQQVVPGKTRQADRLAGKATLAVSTTPTKKATKKTPAKSTAKASRGKTSARPGKQQGARAARKKG